METVELESPPSLPPLYARVLGASLLPGGDGELPGKRLLVRGVGIAADHVAAYGRVCGFGLRSAAPATYPHVLAFPLHLSLMTERSFPFSALGLLHIENRIEALAPLPVGGSVDLAVWAEGLRDHERGRQFDVLAEAELDGEVAWRERSTYLRLEKSKGGSSGERERRGSPAEFEATAEWTIPGDIGRRYAAVSGDRNPIHMHPLLARAFGAPTTIAHGMWTTARSLAAFEGWTPDAFTLETEFKSALRIPGKATLRSRREAGGFGFRVESPDAERAYVLGRLTGSGAGGR